MYQTEQNQQQKTFQEPNWLTPKFENIPDELKSQPWAVWIAEPRLDRNGKPTGKWNKAPRNPITGIKIGANQPEAFGTYDEAINAYATGKYTGIGVLLTGNDITGIDIDNVGQLIQEGRPIVEWLHKAIVDGVYCEVSPSRKGLRLFVNGRLSFGGRKYDCLEIYDDKRFLTITGHIYSEKEGA